MARISAIMRAANTEIQDYCLEAAIRSAFLVCDEVCIALGQSEDTTIEVVAALQAEYGKDRLRCSFRTWRFDQDWQVKAWTQAVAMAQGDWFFLIDADDAIHEQDAEKIRAYAERDDLDLVTFPVLHFYLTPHWTIHSVAFYKRHCRMGRRQVDYRMKNRRPENPRAPVCDLVANMDGQEVLCHTYTGARQLASRTPFYHYGWVRDGIAMRQHKDKMRGWYEDLPEYMDGHIPQGVQPFDWALGKNRKWLKAFEGTHPTVMAAWLARHAEVFAGREAEIGDTGPFTIEKIEGKSGEGSK